MTDEEQLDATVIRDLAEAMPRLSMYRLTASQRIFLKKFESILESFKRESRFAINEMIQ